MTLLLRNLQNLVQSPFRKRMLSLKEEAVVSYHVLPIDLDENRHMNNARYLNYLETSRLDLQIRSGFLKLGIKNKWYVVVRRLEIDYVRPLKLFQAFEVGTRVVAADEELILFQEMRSNGKSVSQAIVYLVIKKGRDRVYGDDYLKPLGFSQEEIEVPEGIAKKIHRK